MSESAHALQGVMVDQPYTSSLDQPLASTFGTFPSDDQVCVDEALNALEWCPWPHDARAVSAAGCVLAVRRCGYWIVYELDDDARELIVMAILDV